MAIHATKPKKEPYTCVNGQGISIYNENKQNQKKVVYRSLFEGIRTHKGCFYYLHGTCEK